jgi:hypothetical protein
MALQLEERTALPLSEISAFALRPGEEGTELIAVADDDFGVLCVPLSDTGRLGESDRHELWRKLPMDLVAESDGSQFEGVACDGAGHVLLLQEGPERVLILDPGLDRLVQAIRLTVDPDEPEFGARWHEDDNARGEAMLLLRDGHLLIAKQRKPIRLIEFGPPGADPLGVSGDTMLPPRAPYAMALASDGKVDFAVLASWGLADGQDEDEFESINDMACDTEGRLFVLSSRSRRIGCIEEKLRPNETHAKFARMWDLPEGTPGGEDDRPEALALPFPGAVLVGIDTKKPGDNVAFLRGLST